MPSTNKFNPIHLYVITFVLIMFLTINQYDVKIIERDKGCPPFMLPPPEPMPVLPKITSDALENKDMLIKMLSEHIKRQTERNNRNDAKMREEYQKYHNCIEKSH